MNKIRQHGVSLSGLLMWGIAIALVAITGMRVIPSVIEYYKARKVIHSTVAQTNSTSTVADVRKAYAKFATVDSLDLRPEELEITKENNQVVISFSYEKRIPLFGNVSLLIDYSASTGGNAQE